MSFENSPLTEEAQFTLEKPDDWAKPCKKCYYGGYCAFCWVCDYLNIEGHRRPCPPPTPERPCAAFRPKNVTEADNPVAQRFTGPAMSPVRDIPIQTVKWDVEKAAKLLKEDGKTVVEVANELGISAKKIYAYRKRHPEIFGPVKPRNMLEPAWDVEGVIAKLEEGVPLHEVCDQMHVKTSTVSSWFSRHPDRKPEIRKAPCRKKGPAWDLERAKEMLANDIPIKQIASELGVSGPIISAYFHNHPEERPKPPGHCGRQLTWSIEKVISLLKQGYSIPQAANEIGTSSTNLRSYFNRHPEEWPDLTA